MKAWSAFATILIAGIAVAQTVPVTEPPTQNPTPPRRPVSPPINAEEKAEVLESIKGVVEKRAFVPNVDFSKWSGFVEKRKDTIEKAETISTFTTEVNRALREFGFSHIRLQAPSRAPSTPTPAPAKPEETPAPQFAELFLQQQPTRPSIPAKLTWPEEDVALFKLPTFSTGYSRQDVEKIMADAAKSKFLILDLRFNGGGAISNLRHLLTLMLPKATAYGSFVSRRMFDKYKEANPEGPFDVISIAKWSPDTLKTGEAKQPVYAGKIAVLINRGSGSASEIVANALREILNAPLVGSDSAGAVLASVFAPLKMGFRLQYPVSDYVSIKGIRLEGNPLKPDVVVTAKSSIEIPDPAVHEAIAKLKPKS